MERKGTRVRLDIDIDIHTNSPTHHFLRIYHDVAVTVDPLGPHLRSVLPDLNVVVETHGEMVRDEILR